MSQSDKNIVLKFTRKWQLMLFLEVCLYSLGIGIMVYLLSMNVNVSIVAFLLVSILYFTILKPWRVSNHDSIRFIDSQLKEIEYSSGLLLQPKASLTNLARLQRYRIENKINQGVSQLKPPTNILRTSGIVILLILIGYLGYVTNVKSYFNRSNQVIQPTEIVNFQAIDSVRSGYKAPIITEQELSIYYPSYTNLGSITTTNMNIKAVEGSSVVWSLKFDGKVEKVNLESMGNTYKMKSNKGHYIGKTILKNSGFYNFKFTDTLNQNYTSNLFSIEVVKDEDPDIELINLDKHTIFDFNQQKLLSFTTKIRDDFGLNDVYIIATVSKGSGESVKFREEKLKFNSSAIRGKKDTELSKQIDLDDLKMEPGDELYFYVEASDQKSPKPNIARSETYFAVIKDTITDQFGVEGTLGVNRMPDYFRSQRQLIIDTEKLIASKRKLSKHDFKFTSNELGFDQKALRLKYSAFMGEETENIDIVDEENIEVLEAQQDNNNEDDPLAEYTHDHDGDNEHNLVENKDEKKNENNKNPLKEFIHDHEDPEAATLFEESLKAKLLKALQQMWDSELYLRLYQPEKSLPYQYKALEYIQEIKNSARIYVHRIGFDPPPIKEDKRLTGKLDKVKSFTKQEDITDKDNYKFMREASSRLEELIRQELNPTAADQFLFEQTGKELAVIAIEEPGKHLKTLQQLKELTIYGKKSVVLLKIVQSGLLKALPNAKLNLRKTSGFDDKLNELLLNELLVNDK